jgi:hypothetical protein
MPAPADGLGTSLRATIRRSMSAETKNVIASSAIANGAVNMWIRPPARPGPISAADVSPSATLALTFDQLLAAGHLRRQHLIHHATDDVLNAAQKPGDEQDFYR